MNEQKKQDVSWALLIPLIWFLRIASRGITYWLSPEAAAVETEFDYLQGSPIDRTFLLVLEGLGFAVLLTRKINWIDFVKRNKLLCVLYIYMGISVLWSDFSSVSFKRWVRTIGDLMMVLIVITDIHFTKAFERMLRIWGYLLIPLSVIFIKYFRHLGVAYDHSGQMEMWTGVTTHKNSLGQLASMSAIFFFWIFLTKFFKKRLLDIPIFLMSLWLLTGSRTATSRTSVGVFLIGAAVLLLLLLLRKNVGATRIIVTVLVWGLLVTNTLSQYLYSRDLVPWMAVIIGEDATLTGRTLLWDELLKIAAQHQILGTGYGGFWIGNIGNNLWETFQWNPGQAHNGYIDVYIDLGLIGLILLIALIVVTYKNILVNLSADSDFGRLRMVLLSVILISNITESSFLKPTSLLWFFFLLIAVNFPEPLPEMPSEAKSNSRKVKRMHRSKLVSVS